MARKKIIRPESISGGYAPIPWHVLDSTAFMGASDKAKALLFALMRQHNGCNNGHFQLTKTWLYRQGWKCNEINIKARRELIERGLVIQTKFGGLNMGADLFALTWYQITNFEGLDITAKGYHKGLYMLCDLPPTSRRKPPVRKQKMQFNDRIESVPVAEPAKHFTGTIGVSKMSISEDVTGTIVGNNVFIPLPINKRLNRIVGVKGKSGVVKEKQLLTVVN